MEAYRSELTEALHREGFCEVAALAAWTLAEEQADEEQEEIMSQQRLVQEANEELMQLQRLNHEEVFVPASVHAAWQFLKGFPVDEEELALQGVTALAGIEFEEQLIDLPETLENLDELHSLTFKGWSEQDTECDTLALPSSLKSLSFADGVNHLERMNLPRRLQLLLLGDSWGEGPPTLPDELQSLSFGKRFNESVQHVIFPKRLQILNFGDNFNQNLDGILLPDNLQSLTFGAHFNQSLEFVTFPMGLVSLTFGARFNQPLERVNLPVQLRSLTLGDEYDQTLEHVTLPEGLQELALGDLFNQTLDGVTFPQLQSLKLSRRFNENVDAVSFPSGLRILTFGDFFNQSLEHVSFPPGLQHLVFGDYFNQSLEKVTLPPELQSLTLGLAFDQALPTWPELKELTFCGQNYHGIENIQLPSTLQELRCDGLWVSASSQRACA